MHTEDQMYEFDGDEQIANTFSFYPIGGGYGSAIDEFRGAIDIEEPL